VLETVRLDRDAYLLGLRARLRQPDDEDLETRLLDARGEMLRRLESDPRLSRLVERFDPDRYNTNATLAENLIFGTATGEGLDIDRLVANAYFMSILDGQNLTGELMQVGYRIAATMVELFAELPPDHEYFSQFSFIDAEELPEYR
ncbi:MAG: ABC transporter ATP-binding protein, partial [Geminicoccaceae bacterium]|nr:ABC transporter ATP-binding protein [Geminicoccaceae bacterium]